MKSILNLSFIVTMWIMGLLFSRSMVLGYADCPECGVCQQLYKPVCGEDGVTYGNACQLGCEKSCRKPGLKIVHDGECGNPVMYKYH